MSRPVSRKVSILAISDGQTLHASLRSTKNLTQSYSPQDNNCVPDWSATDKQNNPRLYPVLTLGSTLRGVFGQETWYYNDIALEFGSTESTDYPGWYECTNFTKDGQPMFLKAATRDNKAKIGTLEMPTLRINENLASASNLDIDLVSVAGNVEENGALIPFRVSAEVRLAELTASGYQGEVDGNGFDIYTKNTAAAGWGAVESALTAGSYVKYEALLYSGSSALSKSEYAVIWKLGSKEVNANNFPADGTSKSGLGYDIRLSESNEAHTLLVGEPQVEDVTVLTVEFYVENALVATRIIEIDDTQDPSYMWVTYEINGTAAGQNGETATLHPGQSVTYKFYMGKNDDADTSKIDTDYNTFKFLPMNAAGEVIDVDEDAGIADLASETQDAEGWVTLTATHNHVSTVSGGGKVAQFTVTHAEAKKAGGNITGLVSAAIE